MTEPQIDYLWELATRDDDAGRLQEEFPEVDWAAAEARKEARWAERRAQRALEPPSRISLADIDAVTQSIFSAERVADLFSTSPLLGKFRR